MTYLIYIDHPGGFNDYEYLPGDIDGDDVVSRKLGIKVKFICNSYAKISKGDIYEVPFKNLEDVTVFILKCDYNLVDRDKVEKYKNRKK